MRTKTCMPKTIGPALGLAFHCSAVSIRTICSSFALIVVSFAGTTGLYNEAAASVTLQPIGATTDMGEYIRHDLRGEFVFSASHVIDKSGLMPLYISNVSDFDGYLDSNPTAAAEALTLEYFRVLHFVGD